MEHGTYWVGESWDELKHLRQVWGSEAASALLCPEPIISKWLIQGHLC